VALPRIRSFGASKGAKTTKKKASKKGKKASKSVRWAEAGDLEQIRFFIKDSAQKDSMDADKGGIGSGAGAMGGGGFLDAAGRERLKERQLLFALTGMKVHRVTIAWRVPRPVAGSAAGVECQSAYVGAAESRLKGVLEAVYIRDNQIPRGPQSGYVDRSAFDDSATAAIPLHEIVRTFYHHTMMYPSPPFLDA
jgi:hypothetical protein